VLPPPERFRHATHGWRKRSRVVNNWIVVDYLYCFIGIPRISGLTDVYLEAYLLYYV
jgi:hypothetical protein